MQQLDALAREAVALAGAQVPLSAAEAEVDRQMQVCNACRYCEGFCAVFPAMTRRLAFSKADIHYLANLCHNCGACLHACQYAPPHEFAVNVPRAMAEVRVQTYAEFAWPPALGALYRRNGATLALATGLGLALFLIVALFGAVFVFALVALAIGASRFWRQAAPGPASRAAAAEATFDALRLKYLDGGHGEGCNDADDRFTLWRRRFHHLTFYGFLLCFAATGVATLYHYVLRLPAPYPVTALPVLLGIAGGLGLLAGPAGLLWLNLGRHPLHGDPAQAAMDRGFIALLLLNSITGLALLAWRDSVAMPLLLAVHLGFVMALFATMPYGKFAHAIYRAAALLKWAIERRQPSTLRLKED